MIKFREITPILAAAGSIKYLIIALYSLANWMHQLILETWFLVGKKQGIDDRFGLLIGHDSRPRFLKFFHHLYFSLYLLKSILLIHDKQGLELIVHALRASIVPL